MRILILGHNQVLDSNRSRWKKMAEFFPDVDITVVPPQSWDKPDLGTDPVNFTAKREEYGNYRVKPNRIFPGNFRAIYLSLDLTLLSKPDIIWIYMDPQGFMMQQLVLYRNIFARQAKIVCCTSTNIPTRTDRCDKYLRYHFAVSNIDAFSTGTQEVIDRLRGEGLKHPIFHKVVTGADEQLWHPGDEPELKKRLKLSDFVVGFVGRHEEAKGLPQLLKALEGLDGDWSFLSLGDGPMKQEVEERLRRLPGNRSIVMMGYIPREQTPPYFRCMDVLVLFSQQIGVSREPAGIVIMEANLSRVVSVVSDLPGPAEIAGETGIIVPAKDVDTLREKLAFLRDNPFVRHQMAQAAYERALRQFSTSSLARDTYGFFKQLQGALAENSITICQ